MKKPTLVVGNYLRLTTMMAVAAAVGRQPLGVFGGSPRKEKPKAVIYSVESITPGKQHAWCESNVGRIKKPLSSIPQDVLARFRKRVVA